MIYRSLFYLLTKLVTGLNRLFGDELNFALNAFKNFSCDYNQYS